MEKTKTVLKPWKKEKVKEVIDLIKAYPVIGLIDATHLPSKQLQAIRHNIRKEALIKNIKKSFLLRAFEETKNTELISKIEGSPIVILSKLNAFKLNKLIEKNKSKSAIKPGQIAPFDLIIPAGETPFTPGPIIGEFGQLGVKAKIVAGKINVLNDSTVVKAGEKASALASSMLMRLGIKPLEIGFKIVAIKDGSTIFSKEDLSLDVESLISLSYLQAKNLALNAGIIMKEFINELLMKAQFNALIINGIVHPDQKIVTEHKVEAKQETKKKEEKSDEVSTEQAASGLADLFG